MNRLCIVSSLYVMYIIIYNNVAMQLYTRNADNVSPSGNLAGEEVDGIYRTKCNEETVRLAIKLAYSAHYQRTKNAPSPTTYGTK